MKTSCELAKKLNKLPEDILIGDTLFVLFITKHHINDKETVWDIQYRDEADNALLVVEHTHLQAAVDNTLATLKTLRYDETPEGHLMKAIFG